MNSIIDAQLDFNKCTEKKEDDPDLLRTARCTCGHTVITYYEVTESVKEDLDKECSICHTKPKEHMISGFVLVNSLSIHHDSTGCLINMDEQYSGFRRGSEIFLVKVKDKHLISRIEWLKPIKNIPYDNK